MGRKRVITEKRYFVNWISNGFCYRTTANCTWKQVLESKKIAKALGEKIEYEYSHTNKYEY